MRDDDTFPGRSQRFLGLAVLVAGALAEAGNIYYLLFLRRGGDIAYLLFHRHFSNPHMLRDPIGGLGVAVPALLLAYGSTLLVLGRAPKIGGAPSEAALAEARRKTFTHVRDPDPTSRLLSALTVGFLVIQLVLLWAVAFRG